VVESAPADRAGLHAERKAHARAPRLRRPHLFDVTGQHPSPELDDVHESDDDDHVDVDASDRDGEDTKTTSSVARNFLSVTTSSVKPVAPISTRTRERRVVRNLGPGFESVDMPLLGPGNWTLSASGQRPSRQLRGDASPSSVKWSWAPTRVVSWRSLLPRPGRPHVATNTEQVNRFAGPLQGSALAIYFVLLPYVVVTKWHRTPRQNDGTLVRALLVALALFWLIFLGQVIRDVWRLRRVEVPAPVAVRGSPVASSLSCRCSFHLSGRARARRRTAQSTIDRSLALTPSRPAPVTPPNRIRPRGLPVRASCRSPSWRNDAAT